MDSRAVADAFGTSRGSGDRGDPSREGGERALVRAAAAADDACRRLPRETPERALWLARSAALSRGLRRTLRGADAGVRAAIASHLDDLVDASGEDLVLLRRLLLFLQYVHHYRDLCEDPRVPVEVRAHARGLRFHLFDRVARARRDPEIERFAARRNAIFIELGIRPRSPALLDWCDVAVRIATGGPLRAALAAMPAASAERLLAAKVRFDLLAIELNVALDDLADDGRDAGLFALTVARVFGRDAFAGASAVGRHFLGHLARAEAALGGEETAQARYVDLVAELYREVVGAGRALAGERWDEATWSAELRRILGAMMLSLVENERPELLAEVDWRADFHGDDRLAVEAANGNRVVFELVGLWCHERVVGRDLASGARARLRAVFEDLQVAQQLGNCLATLAREIDDGDRSNFTLDRAAARWRGMSIARRADLVRESGLARPLHRLSLPLETDEIIDALFRILRRGADGERAAAAECLARIVDRSGAVGEIFEAWRSRVNAAADGLDALGFCGATSKGAQIELLLLHLLLLKKSPFAEAGERR